MEAKDETSPAAEEDFVDHMVVELEGGESTTTKKKGEKKKKKGAAKDDDEEGDDVYEVTESKLPVQVHFKNQGGTEAFDGTLMSDVELEI